MNLRRFALLSIATLLTSAAALAQGPAAPNDPADKDAGEKKTVVYESVTVTAPGEVRTEQTLNSETLKETSPVASPVMSIAKLPSVNVSTADPYGSYEWATRISLRGFNQNQLGFTLDDIPLGDMSYGNWNGLHISRAAINENLGRVVISQGTGALETASNSNLGGTIQFFTLDPSNQRSFTVDQSFGSFNAFRTVGRFESGLLPHGVKFYVTGVYNLAEKWKGAGDIGQNYWQLNSKIVKEFGSKGVLSAFVNYSDRKEVDYQDLSKVYARKLGYNFDNYGKWSDSVQAAYACAGLGDFPSPVNGLSYTAGDGFSGDDPCDAAYYAGAGLRKDLLAGLNYKTSFGKGWLWKSTAYGHRNDGVGLWFMPTAEGGSTMFNLFEYYTGSPIAMRTSEYGNTRGGFLSSLSYESGRNKIEGGLWFERQSFDLARRFYTTSENAPLHSLYDFPKSSSAFLTQWAYTFDTTVYQLHLQDEFKATNKLTVSAGFKAASTDTTGKLTEVYQAFYTNAYGYFPPPSGEMDASKPFLPQFGLNYKLDKKSELYANAAYNMRTYTAGGAGYGASPWNTSTQSYFDALKKTLKPETSWMEEAGYRYKGGTLEAQASYFHVNFYDRLMAAAVGSGIAGNPSVLSNVGGVTTNGIDVAGTVQLGHGVAFYNGFTWNRSTYDDDITTFDSSNNATVHAIENQLVVDTPEFLYKNELSYHVKNFRAQIGADYMSKRYYTYTNDASVDGRAIANLGLAYERKEAGAFQDVKLQLNIYNLFDEKYFSTMGTNGYTWNDPSGSWQSLQVGAPRTFSGTVSVKF